MFRALVRMFGFVMKRRWLRRFICFVVLVPVCVFVASNIFLNSRWTKGQIAKRLEAKTGVAWEVGTVNWTPDGKVHVYDARATLGEGELVVERIDIEPLIREGLRGDMKFREVVVERPRLEVGLDWLEGEIKKRVEVEEPRVVRPQPPVVAKVDPPVRVTPDVEPAGGERPAVVKPSVAGGEVEPVKPAVVQNGDREVPRRVEEVVEIREELPSWLRIEDAVVVVKDGERTLLELSGVDAELPLGGEGLDGFLSLGRLAIGGKDVLDEWQVEFKREDGMLVCRVKDGEMFGVEYDFVAEVKLVGREAYFLAKGVAQPQDIEIDQKVEGTGFDIGAKGLWGEGAVEGNLLSPSSWRGGLMVFADRVHFGEHHREGHWDFERMKFSGRLSRGIFSVPDFGMWSEDMSVMGNGYASLDGRVTGVTRLIGDLGVMNWFTGVKNGVGILRGQRASLVSQWDNTDRYYVDLQFDGPIRELEWKADKVSDWEPFWPDVQRMKEFIKLERLEDIDGVQRQLPNF